MKLSISSFTRHISKLFKLAPEVSEALNKNRPIVALESTIITHGMPFPYNLVLAEKVEKILKINNVVPATISIYNGRIHCGLTTETIQRISDDETKLVKVNCSDIPIFLEKSKHSNILGGTTVSSTLAIAKELGINIFATGGIGGIHQENATDISADIYQLRQSNKMILICSGVKSILNVNSTLEFFESLGIPLMLWRNEEELIELFDGRFEVKNNPANLSNEFFPTFYSRENGENLKISNFIKDENEFQSIYNNFTNANSGILLAVPIPTQHELNFNLINEYTKIAQEKLKENNISGKAVTPFILKQLHNLSEGVTVTANQALLINNVYVAAKVANKLYSKSDIKYPRMKFKTQENFHPNKSSKILCIGAVNVDLTITKQDSSIESPNSTTPSNIDISVGGVARNLAAAFSLISNESYDTQFISIIGDDLFGSHIINDFQKNFPNLDISLMLRSNDKDYHTSTFTLLQSTDRQPIAVYGDMKIHQELFPKLFKHESLLLENVKNANLICFDLNLSKEIFDLIIRIGKETQTKICIEPTTIAKLDILRNCKLEKPYLSYIDFITPNRYELHELVIMFCDGELFNQIEISSEFQGIEEVVKDAMNLQTIFPNLNLIVSCDKDGAFILPANNDNIVDKLKEIRYVRNDKIDLITSVNGAGDCLKATVLANWLFNREDNFYKILKKGLTAAKISMSEITTVSSQLKKLHLK
ncbi:hypothetical protein SNEBB_005193 [Seison nebaliae]|nr:hypothetical protein SNEBB_005193 [Seison nebaliae]